MGIQNIDKKEVANLEVGFIGCGGHAFRNVYPCLQYAPVDLIATCDLEESRAQAFARQFGARRSYTDHRAMLDAEVLDAVFIVTNYAPDNGPRYPGLAIDCMQAGCHAWIEKPPAASVAEIDRMAEVEERSGRFTMVGLKKAFFPALRRLKDISQRPEFGSLTSITLKYPQYVPDEGEKDLSTSGPMRGFLDHIVHPGSIIDYLMGPIRHLYYERSPNGAGAVVLKFVSGATGLLDLSHGRSGTGPLERVEIVGEGANAVVDNGVKLTYYRKGGRGPGGYGRATEYMGDDGSAPIVWEPEWSLGQLYNKALFLLGYGFEVIEFAEAIIESRRPSYGGLDAARELLKLYEAFLQPPGQVITINP